MSNLAFPSPPAQLKHAVPHPKTAGLSRTSGRIYPPGFPVLKPHLISSKKAQHRKKLSSLYRFSKTKTYFEQCFDIVRVLGNGSFGQVLGVKCKETGREFAVKRALRTFESSGKRYRQLQEVLNHELISPQPNIVRFEKAWEERGRLYIQTELCGASLHDYREHYGPLLENESWTVFVDTLKAVERLHSLDMLHLDVKPSNIYITRDRRSCKLGDFGLSVNLKKNSADWAEEGDRIYMAPELLNEAATFAADLYSLGVTMLELATDVDLEAMKDNIRQGTIPRSLFKGTPTLLRDEIILLLNKDPTARPTATELLERLMDANLPRTKFREINIDKQSTPDDMDCYLDNDWDFDSEDVIHPPSLRAKRKYDCTAFGTPPVIKRLVFDELDESQLPSPKADPNNVGHNTPAFTRILEFKGSPVSPPPKKARELLSPEEGEQDSSR